MYATRLNKRTLRECAKSAKLTRCLAVALAVKRHTSFLHSYREVAECAGVSEATIRRLMPTLIERGFVSVIEKEGGKRTFAFRILRARKFVSKFGTGEMISPRHSDIILDDGNTDFTNIKTITTALRALAIRERQSRREYLRQVAHTAQDPDKGTSLEKIKKARKILGHYGGRFSDKGMSSRYLYKVLGCGSQSLKDVISYGESRGLFVRYVPSPVYVMVGRGQGCNAFESMEEEGFQWFTRSCVARRESAHFCLETIIRY